MQNYDYLSSSSRTGSSGTDSGLDLKNVKKLELNDSSARYIDGKSSSGVVAFPSSEVFPASPQRDKLKSSKTRHLSHLSPTNAMVATTGTKDRTKRYSASSTPPATLVKLLKAQELTTKETKALLTAALTRLDDVSARATRAESQLRSREASAIVSYAQLTEDAVRAQEAATRARREAEAYKLQLRLRDEEVRKERERVQAEERMRAEAEKEAQRARSLARKWREEGRIMKAREDGRRTGYGEGLQRGRLVIAAAIAAKDSPGERGLVGDGAAYIEEYNEDSDNQPRRTDYTRNRGSRSRKSELTSRHTNPRERPPPRHERVDSTPVRSRESELSPPTQQPSPSIPEHQSPPRPPEFLPSPVREPVPPSQALTLHRARSIQTDPSLFQSERTRSRTTSSVTSSAPSRALSEHRDPPPPQIHVQPSPPTPPPPVVIEPPANERQSIKSEPFSPQIMQPDPSPIPIPAPVSQVPFAPGIDPQYASYGPSPPEPYTEPQPSYFPMPAPPLSIVLTRPPPEEERDVQTPSTLTNETSLTGLNSFRGLRGLPPLPSRASSAGSGNSTGRFERGGGFDPDLSTIHEHSREGTAFGGEEDFRSNGVLSPERSRDVEHWRLSLHSVHIRLANPQVILTFFDRLLRLRIRGRGLIH
ncbi:hypothetical protein GYMLUDRAFT_576122 [Collybiopsis luxurians FD-317 M1]|uniref:Uncharacterized protein n=1 Tax=Collybiopsis luxurians FD-317 M1 TaxID=944289 RepID=A0A0D0CZ30_9AGAR|nr:hypothetical protein GYMLUDRAFT_576122 [Collybiopsis luxurians FD-317 M1]